MKISKQMLQGRWKSARKEAGDKWQNQSFKAWLKDNGKSVINHFQQKAEGELDFTDNALKLVEEFI